MFRSESVRNRPGHRRPAPLLAVSGTRFVPDTCHDTRNRVLARVSVTASGCPAEIRGYTHARARAHLYTHPSCNGHPDTSSTGAALRCPVHKKEADTAGHLAWEPDTVSAKSMRDAMPQTAAFVDALRETFGREGIDQSIRAGMAGVPGKFHAIEAGHEIGTPIDDAGKKVAPEIRLCLFAGEHEE